MPRRFLLFLLVLVVVCCRDGHFVSAEEATETPKLRLQLFDPGVFGKSTKDAVVLLKPKEDGQIEPETIMVDVTKGRYYAATVRYPKCLTLGQARDDLNQLYGKWEREAFAKDPELALWRNEDDQFAISLSEDDDNLVVIYINFSMVTEEMFFKGFSQAIRELEKEKQETEPAE